MTKTVPLFSIVTPSYNQAAFIEATIQSVLAQAGPFVIEYIIADGGSSDGSVEIIERYAGLVSEKKLTLACEGINLIWWSRPDKGQSDAINQGFRKATGEFAAWLNSDDVYEPNALNEAATVFDKNPEVGMIYGNYSEIDSGGKLIRRRKVS